MVNTSALFEVGDKEAPVLRFTNKASVCLVLVELIIWEVALDNLFVLDHAVLVEDDDAAHSSTSAAEVSYTGNRLPSCIIIVSLKA